MACHAGHLTAHNAGTSHYFANVRHELRTLLTLIRGPLEDLVAARYGELSPSVVAHLNLSLRNTEKLQTLIDGLLTLPQEEILPAATNVVPPGLSTSAPMDKESARDQQQAPNSATDPRPSVLLVEDDLDMRSLLRDHLTPVYQVFEARDVADGFEMARQVDPTLAISNGMMPKVEGLSFIEALRADEALRHVPVILLSGRSELNDRLTGLNAWADDYLVKPFGVEELLLRVRNLIASRTALRKQYERRVVAIPTEELDLHSADELFLEKARGAVNQNLADQTFDVASLAKVMFLSEQTLRRRLDALAGVTPAVFIRRIRLDYVHQLLEKRVVTMVNEAAFSVGFRSAGYFSRLFRSYFGYSVQDLLRRSDSTMTQDT